MSKIRTLDGKMHPKTMLHMCAEQVVTGDHVLVLILKSDGRTQLWRTEMPPAQLGLASLVVQHDAVTSIQTYPVDPERPGA